MMIRLVALLLMVIPSLCIADESRFQVDEVKVGTQRFIDVVFGKSPPSLADRIRFGGRESLENDETILEYAICKHQFGTIDPAHDKECDEKVLKPRYSHPDQVESLYYNLLRKKIDATSDMFKIESVRYIEGITGKTAGYYLVTVDIENKNLHPSDPRSVHKQILLRHVNSPIQVPEGGTVSVQAVVIPAHQYVMPQTN